MILTAIAYKTLPYDTMVKRLAVAFRRDYAGTLLTKRDANETVRKYLSRGSAKIAQDIYTEAQLQRAVENRRIRNRRSTGPSLKTRLELRIQAAVRESYNKCGYRRAQGKWAGGEHTLDVSLDFVVAASSKTERVYSANGKWSGKNSRHTIKVKPDWLRTVYRPGRAVVDGRLVLRASEQEPGRWWVYYVGQTRGTGIEPREGYVTREDGQLRLRA
jgi:hypothetical protein